MTERASLDKKPHEVAAMFDGVARRYDLTNTLLSGGLDRRWRKRTRQCLELEPGQRVLDLAAGTGVSTVELRQTGAFAVGCDFSLGMLRVGRENKDRRHVPLVAGDGDAPAVPRRGLRRGDHRLRAAQHRRRARSPCARWRASSGRAGDW